MSLEKVCKGCNEQKPKREFVTVHGHANPRGKYCRDCFAKHQKEHAVSLMDGRDSCLYCGKMIEKYCDFDENGNSVNHYLEMDHMDPIALGGHDPNTFDLETGEFDSTSANTVYVCRECNQKKGDTPFAEWLEQLAPPFRQLAHEVYLAKRPK